MLARGGCVNYLDLFSGCGGFRLGLQKAGIVPENEFHSEIDKYADQIYTKHYPQSENLGDVTKITTDGTIQGHKIDLITFGFPCQDLSVAGKGTGLEGARSGLFYEATRLIRELKPDIFIFENVKGLLTSKSGEDFKAVLQEIADIGLYDCQWQLVNTRWLLPQNRERVFFVGIATGSKRSGQQIFPFTEDGGWVDERKEQLPREVKPSQTGNCLTARMHKMACTDNYVLEQITNQARQGERVYNGNGISSCISSNGSHNGKTGLYAIPVLTPERAKKRQNGRRFKEDGDPAFTLTAQDKHGVYDGHYIRRLTPTECARLQGFTDNWHDGVSDTQAYKMYGNAVTADIADMIFNRIYI